MKCLEIPNNDATQRLEQAFQLVFQTSQDEYCGLCNKFRPLGGLPRAWMIKGDSGSGKTYLAKALSKKYSVHYSATITIGELAIMYPGDILKGLKTYLKSIKNHAKAVVILDNIELLFPREDSDFALIYAFQSWMQSIAEHEEKSPGLLLSPNSSTIPAELAKTTSGPRVMVLGLTQDSRGLDPSVMKLFDEVIDLDIPTPEERTVILKACTLNHNIVLQSQRDQQLSDMSATPSSALNSISGSKESNGSLEHISMKCHGYLPADLDALCIQATIVANKQGRGMNQLAASDFLEAMKTIRVSALRQSTSVQKVDPVHWSDIGGLDNVKVSVMEFYSKPDIVEMDIYGPPGTGKTLLAKAVATESEANFMAVSIPDLIKGEVGESEKAIAKIFKMANRCTPCIVFLDELEAIFGSRESSGGLGKQLISQLLLELDDCVKGVVILAATNHPEAIDSSILRPGRLDRLVYVPPPTFDERVMILEILKQSTKFSDNIDLRTVSNLTNNFTGADMKALVRKAGLLALKANRTCIEAQDFFTASSEVRPSVSQFGLMRYEQFRRK
ncbi:hypothetical protein BGX27_010800 [Mortierella sp. AM989]|nr:hypothetical protein BGX27_010800 [Mortierella sp. AM989]